MYASPRYHARSSPVYYPSPGSNNGSLYSPTSSSSSSSSSPLKNNRLQQHHQQQMYQHPSAHMYGNYPSHLDLNGASSNSASSNQQQYYSTTSYDGTTHYFSGSSASSSQDGYYMDDLEELMEEQMLAQAAASMNGSPEMTTIPTIPTPIALSKFEQGKTPSGRVLVTSGNQTVEFFSCCVNAPMEVYVAE